MNITFNIVFFLAGISIIAASCKNEEVKSYDCSNVSYTYTTDVKPILDANCAKSGCHNSDSKKDGYDFSNYASAAEGSKKPAFAGSVKHQRGYDKMPKKLSKLNDDDIKKLVCWAEKGSPE